MYGHKLFIVFLLAALIFAGTASAADATITRIVVGAKDRAGLSVSATNAKNTRLPSGVS